MPSEITSARARGGNVAENRPSLRFVPPGEVSIYYRYFKHSTALSAAIAAFPHTIKFIFIIRNIRIFHRCSNNTAGESLRVITLGVIFRVR